MARNVEIKAYVRDNEKTRCLVAEAADAAPQMLTQIDTFFGVPHGRLKLREFEDGEAELIFYERPDTTDPSPLHAGHVSTLTI